MMAIVIDDELELRELSFDDAPALFALTDTNRAYLRQWLPWVDSVRVLGDTETFIARAMLNFETGKVFTAAIRWRERLVGVIGHERIEWEHRIAHPGYWLAEEAQGRGIMTRSVRALVEHTFATLDLNRVEICTAIGNHRSEAVVRRLGFTHEGVRRAGEWLYDRYVDLNVFSMLKHEWRIKSSLRERH